MTPRTVLSSAAIGFAALVFAAPSAAAQDISYTYIEGGLTLDDFDPADIGNVRELSGDDGIGFGGRLSIGLPEFFPFIGFHGVVDYAQSDLNVTISPDITGGTIPAGDFGSTLRELRLAAGANFTVADRASIFAELGYSETVLDISGIGTLIPDELGGEGGFDVKAGARLAVTERVEVNGFFRINPNGQFAQSFNTDDFSLDSFETETFGIGAKFKVWKSLNIVGEYEFGDSINRLRLMARFEF